MARRFERGSGLAIELPTLAGSTSTVLARVMQVKPQESGFWLLACNFIGELSEEEVERVLRLDPHYQPASSTGGDVPAEAWSTSIENVIFFARVHPGEHLRWCVKRLALASDWPLPRGRSIVMRVGKADAEPLKLRVSTCRLMGSCWVVHCKLQAIPSDELLRVLSCPLMT
jgi:hypothetical protein